RKGKSDSKKYAPFALQCLKVFAACANFLMSVTLERGDLLAPRRQEHQVTGQGLSSRADARDLRKIPPFGRNERTPPLRPLRLCARYSEVRLPLCRSKFSAVKFLFPLRLDSPPSLWAPTRSLKERHQIRHFAGI